MSGGRGVATEAQLQNAAAEKVVEAFLAERNDELIQFACDLIATPSPNPPGDETRVAEIVASRLREFGATEVAVLTAAPGRQNVVATFTGERPSPVVILNGHLDTKPPGDPALWSSPPYEPIIRDGMLIGLGAADMKGSVAAIAYAAGAVAKARANGTLRVVFTADEEAGGVYGSKWLAEEGLLQGDVCVIAEPCGVHKDWEAIRLVSRGVAVFRIAVQGTQMHSSLSADLDSVNANIEMAKLMVRMSDAASAILHFDPHALSPLGPLFNVGLFVEGGIGYGIYPGNASFLCDVRALPGMTAEEIEADVRAFISAVMEEQPDLQPEFEMLHWTPPSEIEATHPMVDALERASEDVLGVRPPLGIFPGGTDAPYFSNLAGIPTVPSFGPGRLPYAHAPNEAISTSSILEAARIYALATVRFLNG